MVGKKIILIFLKQKTFKPNKRSTDVFLPQKAEPLAEGARQGRARLIAKIYEIDPLICKKCASSMKIIAVITAPDEVKKILRHLVKTHYTSPGLNPASLN